MATIFTDGTLFASNKLEMVNTCLASIGELPFPDGTLVSELQVGTDGDAARRQVEITMVEIQNIGWYFNTDIRYPLVPDVDDFITVSPNTLRVDVGRYDGNKINRYILKAKRLYDRTNFTFKIFEQVKVDIVWLTDYELLPPAAFRYIALRAARKFQQGVVGSTELDGFTVRDEADALINMQREHLQYQDYNIRPDRMNRNTNGFLRGVLHGGNR